MHRRDAFKLLGAGLAGLALASKKPVLIKKDGPLKLGKQPARPHYGLKLRDYIVPDKLPALPDSFGHADLISDWKMLGNGQAPDNPPDVPYGAGDCAIAEPFHALMLWCAMGKKPIRVDTDCTLEAYSAITGFNRNAYDPITQFNPTDRGSNMQDVSEYWRTQGLKDADGRLHKIDCYLALEPGNVEQLFHAMFLFNAVGIGIECPKEYQQAFFAGRVWDALPNPHIAGGHAILGVGSRNGLIQVITWGGTQLMTAAGYQQFSDESFAYMDEEMLINGKDIDGFDLETLIHDMADLAKDSVPPTPVCEG